MLTMVDWTPIIYLPLFFVLCPFVFLSLLIDPTLFVSSRSHQTFVHFDHWGFISLMSTPFPLIQSVREVEAG